MHLSCQLQEDAENTSLNGFSLKLLQWQSHAGGEVFTNVDSTLHGELLKEAATRIQRWFRYCAQCDASADEDDDADEEDSLDEVSDNSAEAVAVRCAFMASVESCAPSRADEGTWTASQVLSWLDNAMVPADDLETGARMVKN